MTKEISYAGSAESQSCHCASGDVCGERRGMMGRVTARFVALAKRIWHIGELPDDHPVMKWRDWPHWWT